MRPEPLYPKAVRHASAWAFTLSMVLAGLVVLCAGCINPAAIRQAEIEQAVNEGHANDELLLPETRAVGQDNYDAWSAQRYLLDGVPLPEDVEARLRLRGTLPKGYEERE